MSMVVTTVVPEGIVMAADSAMLTFKFMDMINLEKGNVQEAVKNTFNGTCAYDKKNVIGSKILTRSASKLYIMKGNNIAIADGNQRNIKNKSIVPYIKYFCQNNHFDNPKNCAMGLYSYVKNLEPNISAQYHVCGYNHEGNIPVPEFLFVDIKDGIIINAVESVQYGINFCGANEYFSQYVPLINNNITSYSLQDAIDVSMFAINMSIKLERFINREELIIPPIDLLVIEPSGVNWIQQKTLKAEG
jgi:hypothetical protein